MPQTLTRDIREVLLEEIIALQPKSAIEAPLAQKGVLNAAAKRLGGYDQQAILTQWGELFRTGLLAWGLNLSNPDPPFFHLTQQGRQALSKATRDPSNPAGYLRNLYSTARLNAVAMSYLVEGLDCYVDGHFKAAAVMIGATTESVILELADLTAEKLASLNMQVPKALRDWKVKTVSDALHSFFGSQKLPHALKEPFGAYWAAFALQIRTTRNDAGHPTSVEPVTPDAVHASLLIFPELARLANQLAIWMQEDFT